MKTLSIILSIFFLNCLTLFSNQSCIANKNKFPDDMGNKLDSLITAIVQNNNLPSVVVGVFIPNEKDYLITKGMANLETNLPREFNDQYRIASITKTFIATAIL